MLHPLVRALATLWWLWVLVGLIFAGRAAKFLWVQRRLRRAGIREIDAMDGTTFERRLGVLFSDLGYRVELTGSGGGDYGGDLVVSKDGQRTVVQAKCWNQKIGLKAVQEVSSARPIYKADRALVVTNRHFTQQAITLAKANHVALWDRDELIKKLLATGKARPAAVAVAPDNLSLNGVLAASSMPAVRAEVAQVGTSTADIGAFCARCGEGVSEKVRAYCLARPKRYAGLVYCYEHQRAVKQSP